MENIKQGKIEQIRQEILKYFTDKGHTFDHTKRVHNLAVRIAKSEKNVDLEVIRLASLLHDVARFKETPKSDKCHALEGSKMARKILLKHGYDKEKIDKICDCISTHRYSKCLKAKSREGEILQDADRLDALGAIAIARIFFRGGSRGKIMHDPNIPPSRVYPSKKESETSFNHFKDKILNIKPETFKTKLARKIAKSRYKYIKNFVDRFEKEWEGKL